MRTLGVCFLDPAGHFRAAPEAEAAAPRARPRRCGKPGRRGRRSPRPSLAAPQTRAGMAGSAGRGLCARLARSCPPGAAAPAARRRSAFSGPAAAAAPPRRRRGLRAEGWGRVAEPAPPPCWV